MNYPKGLCAVFRKKENQIRIGISILACSFFLFPFSTKASHIVGGEMSYTCLGGNTFEVKLTVYRDCFYGAPNANFDPEASIGIFDSNNQLVLSLNDAPGGQLLIPETEDDTLSIVLSDPCLFAPNDVCVHSMTYVDTVVLPPISGGYQLVYQRCCRNSSISNIISSFDTGASFVINISETALLECNSSPQFSAMPPVFLCINEPFIFDQSVIDIDGDSLVYSFCTPFDGASFDDPRPQPPLPPPYDEINWLDPPYNLNNLLGGAPLEIDSNTGIVTATPNTQGLFLVGMCIQEYRDGELISESRREFQYNVGVCTELIADFETPEFQCEDFQVDFNNTSVNAEEYLWFFNDPANPNATSTETNPSYTYSDTGSYTIMLIADPNGPCTDTAYSEINLVKSSLEANFLYVTLDCIDSVRLALIDASIDSEHSIDEWFWFLSDGQTSTVQNPIFVIDSSQTLDVTLVVTSSNSCQEVLQYPIPINLISSNLIPLEYNICIGDTIQLNTNPPTGFPFKYSWSPAEGLSDTSIASPLAYPDEDINYVLTIIDTINICTAVLETEFNVSENPTLSIVTASAPCGQETTLTVSSSNSQGYFIWATDDGFNNVISDSSSVTVSTFGETTYYVQSSNSGLCIVMDSIIVLEQSVNVQLVDSQFVCIGDVAIFYATNEDTNDILTYTWFNFDGVGGILSTDSLLEITATEVGQSMFYFQAENQYGCTYLDSVFLSVIDGNATVEIETIYSCINNTVQISNLGSNSNYYQWIIELPNGNDTLVGTSINYEFPNNGIYTVSLIPVSGLPCQLPSESFEINLNQNLANANFEWSYLECENELEIQFSDLSTSIQGSINSWVWTFGNGSVVNEQNPILELSASQQIEVQLIVSTDQGCSDTLIQNIEFSILDLSFFESEAVICDGNSIVLNPLGNSDLEYSWEPSTLLDDPMAVSPIASPTVSTIFTATITDPNNNGCEVVKTVDVIVPVEEVIASYTYEVIDCDGSEVTFSFMDTSTPSGNINNWFYAFSNGQFSNNPNSIMVAQDGETLIIQYQVQTEEGCTDILVDTIQVETFSFNLPQSEIIKCSGVPVNLNSGGNPNYSYLWSPSSTLNNSEIADPIANPIETTQYCVTVTNGNCVQESCVTVLVPDVPLMAAFSYEVSDCINEAVVIFQDETQYSLGNIVEWNWTFSNGQSSNLENPTVVLDQNTLLEVTLEIITDDGCEASFTQEVEVNLININIPSQVVLCDGSPVQLNSGGNPNHSYSWSPSAGLTNDDVPSPFAFPIITTMYTVEISDGDCQVIQSVEVVVPTIQLDPDFSFSIDDCTDVAVIDFIDESQFAPGQIVEWNWQFSNGDSSDISNPIIVIDQSQTLTITLEVTTNNGCIASTFQTIEVNLIDINIQNSIVDCDVNGVELNPGGNQSYNYVWSPTSGLNSSSSANPTANPSSTTTYSVTVTDGPCEITRTVEVIVPSEPLEAGFNFVFDDCTDNAVIEFTDTTLNSNNTITNWNWIFTGNNTVISDLQNPVLTLNESETIIAELTVTTIDGCESTSSESIEVNLIDINVPGSIIFCSTEGITLNPGGNPDYEYNWAPSTGLSATDIASPYISNLTQTTNYSVTVTNGNCTLTRIIEILVPDIPLQADFDIVYLNCIDSAVLQFNDASVFSGNIIEWDWLVNSQVSDEQNPIFTFYQSQPLNVQLIITTAHGCMDTLNNAFDISIMDDVNISPAVASCNGNGVYLNPNGNPIYSYYWSPGTGLNGDTLSANPFANPDSSVLYTVSITNTGNGCMEERTVAFNVPTNPLIAGFEWELVICSDSAVIEFSDTSSYSGNIIDWNWTMDNGYSDDNQHPIFTFQDADTVNVQLIVISDDGCIDSITNNVIIDIIEIETLQDTIQLCDLDSVYLNPNGNPDLFYTWSPSITLDSANYYNPLAIPLASTEYFVTITSPNNVTCNEVRKVNVLIPTDPIDLNWIYPIDTIICDLSMELNALSNNAVNFIWSDQPDFQNVLSDQSNFTASPNNLATYFLQVSDDVGCILTDSIEIASYAILADLDNEVTLCYGDSIHLEVNLNPLSPIVDLQYTWTPLEGIILDNNTSSPLLSPFDSTEYFLTIENQFGCEYEDSIQVNVLDLEISVAISADLDSIDLGETVQLNVTENPDWIYNWTPCDPNLVSDCGIANPIVAPEETTTFYVEIQDANFGCLHKDSITIFVFEESRCEEPYVFVPKGFTPNDDGLNDILYVRGNYIEEVHFVIFNRWGEKVFETKNLDEGWDGKIDGKIIPPNVFGYYVELKCFGGEEYLMKGNVTLIR